MAVFCLLACMLIVRPTWGDALEGASLQKAGKEPRFRVQGESKSLGKTRRVETREARLPLAEWGINRQRCEVSILLSPLAPVVVLGHVVLLDEHGVDLGVDGGHPLLHALVVPRVQNPGFLRNAFRMSACIPVPSSPKNSGEWVYGNSCCRL